MYLFVLDKYCPFRSIFSDYWPNQQQTLDPTATLGTLVFRDWPTSASLAGPLVVSELFIDDRVAFVVVKGQWRGELLKVCCSVVLLNTLLVVMVESSDSWHSTIRWHYSRDCFSPVHRNWAKFHPW